MARSGSSSRSPRLLAMVLPGPGVELRLTRRLAALQRAGAGALTVTDGDVVIAGSIILTPESAPLPHALLSACAALVLEGSGSGGGSASGGGGALGGAGGLHGWPHMWLPGGSRARGEVSRSAEATHTHTEARETSVCRGSMLCPGG